VLFTNMADTFAAISRDPGALQATLEKSPPTLDTSVRSLRVQRPFLADFTDLSRRLRPAARELPRSLPRINAAFRTGIPVLPRTEKLSRRLKAAFQAADDLFRNPNTLLALTDVRTALSVTKPAIQFIAPYQTVCNHFVYYIHPLGELQSQVQNGPTGGGTVLQNNNKLVDTSQKNTFGTITGSRDVDVPPNEDPRGATKDGRPQMRLFGTPYNPAVDAQGNADCQVGQFGFPKGPLAIDAGGRYNKGTLADGTPSGGNWAIVTNNLPGLLGGTYKSHQLGINNVRDVP
jgi:hypothetical protein